jgi:hypothetical protein
MLLDVERDLFEIFADLSWPRKGRPPARGLAQAFYNAPPQTYHAPLSSRSTVPNRDRILAAVQRGALDRIREIAVSERTHLSPNNRRRRAFDLIIQIADEALHSY